MPRSVGDSLSFIRVSFRLQLGLLGLLLSLAKPDFAQRQISGQVREAGTRQGLAYVNVGIRQKNTGTISRPDGTFTLRIGPEQLGDTLTFSRVGYQDISLPIRSLAENNPVDVVMAERVTELAAVTVSGSRPVEKSYGIKRRNWLLHFTDGMFLNEDIFEIGQLIRVGPGKARITSVNLHINAPRRDSALFRINFYRYENDQPTGRLLERSILQRHPVREGWLRFDLTEHPIWLSGTFVVAVELMPEYTQGRSPIAYEVKLGGFSRSFYRRSSLGTWQSPPHHYCLYVTALVDRSAPEDTDDAEAVPALRLPSRQVQDTFNVCVRLPAGYDPKGSRRYPVVYQLDGNAYFGHLSQAVERRWRKKKQTDEPIVVAIGYRNAYEMDSLRNRDYTYPEALPVDSLPRSGGGDRFYRFLREELLPTVERTYRIDTSRRMLIGHSLGGYFTLYALLRDLAGPATFSAYVAASPSLWYHDQYLLGAFSALPVRRKDAVKPSLLLTVGGLERPEDPAGGFPQIRQVLEHRPDVRVVFRILPNLEHLGTAVPSIEAGIGLKGTW